MKSNKIICIVGATASGKTGLGIKIAKKFNGEIISADSRQIYRGLDIGTGKEGKSAQSVKMTSSKSHITDEIIKTNKFQNVRIKQLRDSLYFADGVPQWLIDIIEPETDCNVFFWAEMARKVVYDIQKRNKLPIIVGGTGLYIQAFIEGFNLENKRKPKTKNRNYQREELENKSLKELQIIYSSLDANSYLLDKQNPHRLIREIERAQSGENPTKKGSKFDVLQIGVKWPKEELDKRIDRRVEKWFKEGFLNEVEDLMKQGAKISWLNKIGLEYKILANYIYYHKLKERGEIKKISKLLSDAKLEERDLASMESVKEKIKIVVHQYAKRQRTWFKRFPEIVWLDKNDYKRAERLIKDFLLK